MAAQLAIRRLRLAFDAPAGAEPETARAAAALEAGLAPRLARRLPADEGADAPVLMIRRLAVVLVHDRSEGIERLADRLADAIAAGVAQAVVRHAGGPVFASRAALAAAFLAALAEGSATERWYFRGFSGLGALPPGRAVRTLLSRDWPGALGVLLACPRTQRERLWDELDPADAREILGGVAAAASEPPPDAGWRLLARAFIEADHRPPEVAALAAVVEAAAALGPACAAGLAAPAREAAARAVLAEGGGVPTSSEPGKAEARATVAAGTGKPPEALRRALATETAARRGEDRWRGSRLLGYALLLPLLAGEPLAAAERWPPPARRSPARTLVGLLALAGAAGGAGALWEDPVWRDIFGLPGRFGTAELAAWTRSIAPRNWRGLAASEPSGVPSLPLPSTLVPGRLASAALGALSGTLIGRLAASLPGFRASTPAFLRANLLGSGGSAQIGAHLVRVRLVRPPLDVLLGMTGLADTEARLPDGRRLILERRP